MLLVFAVLCKGKFLGICWIEGLESPEVVGLY